MTNVSFFPVASGHFDINGPYWLIIAFSTAIGGTLLPVGSTSGVALMNTERMHFVWYLRHLTPKVLLGFAAGMLVLYLETIFM